MLSVRNGWVRKGTKCLEAIDYKHDSKAKTALIATIVIGHQTRDQTFVVLVRDVYGLQRVNEWFVQRAIVRASLQTSYILLTVVNIVIRQGNAARRVQVVRIANNPSSCLSFWDRIPAHVSVVR